jgi:hypothetical protein
MAVRVENIDDRTRSNRDAFDREESGLVNLDSYLPYLVDPTQSVPTRISTKDLSVDRFVHQHAYFTEQLYKQLDLPKEDRDRRLMALRNAPYSQVIMRSYKEVQLHLEKERCVEPPPISVVNDALRDYFDIDIVGATTLSLHEIINAQPEIVSNWMAEKYEQPPEIQALSRRDRINIFTSERKRALNSLSSTKVLPAHVVGSALKRLAAHLRDHTLERVADEHLADEEEYYPLAVPKPGYLKMVGGMVLKHAVGIRPLDEARLIAQALQPETNEAGIAATA